MLSPQTLLSALSSDNLISPVGEGKSFSSTPLDSVSGALQIKLTKARHRRKGLLCIYNGDLLRKELNTQRSS